MAADEGAPRGWGRQFPRVTNDEYLALARARLSSLQHGIVLFLITQTRGTGRLQSGEVLSYDDVEEAREHFGCESRRLFRAQVAGRLGRHPNAVARELRRLIAAGIVVELEPAQKRQAAELAVVLDERRWRLEQLASGGAAPRVARTVAPTVRPTVPPTQVTRSTVNGPVQARAESVNRFAAPSPGTVNRAAPSSGECVNEPVHLLGDLGARRAEERRERETSDRCPEGGRRPDICFLNEEMSVPELRALATSLAAVGSRTRGGSRPLALLHEDVLAPELEPGRDQQDRGIDPEHEHPFQDRTPADMLHE
jgi:hypothetical protein